MEEVMPELNHCESCTCVEKCEGCGSLDVTQYDVEMVPLCQSCWDTMIDEPALITPETQTGPVH